MTNTYTINQGGEFVQLVTMPDSLWIMSRNTLNCIIDDCRVVMRGTIYPDDQKQAAFQVATQCRANLLARGYECYWKGDRG